MELNLLRRACERREEGEAAMLPDGSHQRLI
jgi:hypothetical protein